MKQTCWHTWLREFHEHSQQVCVLPVSELGCLWANNLPPEAVAAYNDLLALSARLATRPPDNTPPR